MHERALEDYIESSAMVRNISCQRKSTMVFTYIPVKTTNLIMNPVVMIIVTKFVARFKQ